MGKKKGANLVTNIANYPRKKPGPGGDFKYFKLKKKLIMLNTKNH